MVCILLPFRWDDYALISPSSPGRWLASHMIKLAIDYLLYSYELNPYCHGLSTLFLSASPTCPMVRAP